MNSPLQGHGEHESELIHAQLKASGQQSVHRAHFLDELVNLVPSDRAHFNKRVDMIDDKPGSPVSIHFKDSTTATADAVIGADGFHSIVREHLLGKEAAKPVFAGSVAYRALVLMDKASTWKPSEKSSRRTAISYAGKVSSRIRYQIPRSSF